MAFQLEANQDIELGGVTYRIAEHPAAPGTAYGQEGRQAIVYKLLASDHNMALKVLKYQFRVPGMVGLSRRLASFASLPGLQVCKRTVLTHSNAAIIRDNLDLLYAVLMPWIEGPTWMEMVLYKEELLPEQSLTLARSLAGVLAAMEQEGLAHCDLSGSNILLPMLAPSFSEEAGQSAVALVDVEQMFGPDLRRPELVPGGSPGYAHKIAPEGMWESDADRLSGALLLAEMLSWCDERVRNLAWGDSYFNPDEMQKDSERYHLLTKVLWERWGDNVERLFNQAWGSDTLADCPPFGEWLAVLPDTVPTMRNSASAHRGVEPKSDDVTPSSDSLPALRELMEQAADFEKQDKLVEALDCYERALDLAPKGSGAASELQLIVDDLRTRLSISPTPTEPLTPDVADTAQVTPDVTDMEPVTPDVRDIEPETPDAKDDGVQADSSSTPENNTQVEEPGTLEDTTQIVEPALQEDTPQAPPAPADDLQNLIDQAFRNSSTADSSTTVEPPAHISTPDQIEGKQETESEVRALIEQARKLRESGDLGGALDVYRNARALAPGDSELTQEYELTESELESRQKQLDTTVQTPSNEIVPQEADVPQAPDTSATLLPIVPPITEQSNDQTDTEIEVVQPTESQADTASVPVVPSAEDNEATVRAMAHEAQNLKNSGDLTGALDLYLKAIELAPEGSASHKALTTQIERIKKQLSVQSDTAHTQPITPPIQPPPLPPEPPTLPVQPDQPSEWLPAPEPKPQPKKSEVSAKQPPSPTVPIAPPKDESIRTGPVLTPTQLDQSKDKTKSSPPFVLIGVAVAVVLLVGAVIVFLALGSKTNSTLADTPVPHTITSTVAATSTTVASPTVPIVVTPPPVLTDTVTATPTAATTPTTIIVSYTYSQSTGTVTTGTADIKNKCDDCVTSVDLPFKFDLYGKEFSSVKVSDNGNLQFDDKAEENEKGGNGQCFPTTSEFFNYAIAVYWADFTTKPEGKGVFTSTTGDAPNRVFHIEWRACYAGGDSSTCKKDGDVHFEARLYESPKGQVELIYDQAPNKGKDGSIGVQETSEPANFVQFAECNTENITRGLSIKFTQVKK